MPSFNIHLAIGKRYIEKNNCIENLEQFYEGIIAPDLVDDKSKSHYSGSKDEQNLVESLKRKVQLDKYIEENSINTDFEKGVFLHLITDYIFFNDFFDTEYLKNNTFDKFINNLYYSYDILDYYLIKKYSLYFEKLNKKMKENIRKNKKNNNVINNKNCINILPYDKINKFIEDVSNIDLAEYKNDVLKNNLLKI